jgi:hypothetical protein
MKPTNNERESHHRRKKTPTSTPTAYLYCIEGQQATETFSMGRRESLDVQFEGGRAGVVDGRHTDTGAPLSRPWDSAGFKSEQVTSGDLQDTVNHGMSCKLQW